MVSFWAKAKELEGATLKTLKRRAYFDIIRVGEAGLVIRTSGGGEFVYPRARIEAVCDHVRNGGEPTVESLSKAGIGKKTGRYTYLPAIVKAILDDGRH
jgi:hypothetical protein